MDIDIDFDFDTFYLFDAMTMSTTMVEDDSRSETNLLFFGGGAVIALILCAICGVCLCTQYRRKSEDKHKKEDKERKKSDLYGADGFDDTLYADGDDNELQQINVVEMSDIDENENENGLTDPQKSNNIWINQNNETLRDIDEDIERALNEK